MTIKVGIAVAEPAASKNREDTVRIASKEYAARTATVEERQLYL